MKKHEEPVRCTCESFPVIMAGIFPAKWEFERVSKVPTRGWYACCMKCYRHGKVGNSPANAAHKWNVMIARVKSHLDSAKKHSA